MDLPHNVLLYLLLLVALALGYWLGRRESRPGKPGPLELKDYYQGLNFLLGEKPELGVDRFIAAMEVTDESIDVHLALASVVRRRGEVDKAIRIHQNLLASPRLDTHHKQLVEFELARDYHAAGLLDRAEGLLRDIVERRDDQAAAARALLIDLYEQEKDWTAAIAVAQQSSPDRALKSRMSHFACELAEQALRAEHFGDAREQARNAVEMDATNPRAHWLAARVALRLDQPKRALGLLQRVVDIEPELAVQVLEPYRLSCERLGSANDYQTFLARCVARMPDVRIVRALLDVAGAAQATVRTELLGHIAKRPDASHVPLLLEWLADADAAEAGAIRALMERIGEVPVDYRCGNCGFRFHQHIWHCPTCRAWGGFALRGG